MALQSNHTTYFDVLSRRNWMNWLWASAGALGLNAALFAGMPHLLHPAQVKPEFEQPIAHINVVRIKRPESPVTRKTEKPPEQPKPKQQPRLRQEQPMRAKLVLPFELNPRLPAGPNTLVLPAAVPSAFDTAGLSAAFSIGDLDTPLTVISRIPPVYPMHAKNRGVEGLVRIRFVVKETGGVDHITIMESKPPGVFDQSVIRCVSSWRFKPGTVEGIAVRVWAETTIQFKLE